MTQGMKISAVNDQCYATAIYYHGPFLALGKEHALRVTEMSYHGEPYNNLVG